MKEDLEMFNRIASKLFESEEKIGVVKQVPYEKLEDILSLELSDEALSSDAFEEHLTQLILKTPRTQTKLFFNQLFGGRRGRAYLGELLAVLLNNSMYTYKVGGPMIKLEKNLLNKLGELLGFNEETEGTIAAGGSMTNFMAITMARDKYDPEARTKGVRKPLVAYTSQESHYSISKNAAFCGIGRDNVRFVPSNDKGEMLTSELEKLILKDIQNGMVPFFINATSGTTVMGAFDPIVDIAFLRDKYGLWLHVDGAYGGSVVFSNKYKHLIKGSHLADSFSINAHKMLGTPITCSIILTKHKNCLYDSFSSEANYLYQGDGDEINPGKISLQCGRRNDALKFWTLWKSIGTSGLAQMVEKEFALADFARSYIRSNPNYTLYSFDESINICFNYKNVPAERLCNSLYVEAKLTVGYGEFNGVTFVRLVMVNSNNSEEDILNFFKIIESFVEEDMTFK
jgi:sulfinoalanine decarboxylase/sulfinoalanine decarboxylase/aspartate 1-decarboxylase